MGWELSLACAHIQVWEGFSAQLGKAEHLYSTLCGIQTTLKHSGMDHTVLLAINTMPAFSGLVPLL